MDKKRKSRRRLARSVEEIEEALRQWAFSSYETNNALSDLGNWYPRIVNEVIPGKSHSHTDDIMWRYTLGKLLPEFLSRKDLQAFLSKHNPDGLSVDEMDAAARGRLFQAALTRLLPIITVPEEQKDERGDEEKGASPQEGEGQPSPQGAGSHSEMGEGGQPSGATPQQPQDGAAAQEDVEAGQESTNKKPLTWDDLSAEDQQKIREDILNGNIPEGPPDEGAQPIDVSTFPDDLKEAFAQQLGQAMQQAVQAFANKVKRWLKQRKSAEQATGVHDEKPEGPQPDPDDQLAQDFMEALESGEFDDLSDFNLDDIPPPEPSEEEASNDDEGYDSSDDMKRQVHGYGSGGKLNDLRIEPSTLEDRIFSVVQEQFLRLAGDPDPSARRPEGQDVHNARKLLKAHWNPGLYPTAYQDLERAPEDIYFILDTSGSVSRYANAIAALAAGSLGLVHLYHGSEAHPQHKVLRNSPLRNYREFLGFGETDSDQYNPQVTGRHEKQQDICAPSVPGYSRWREIPENHYFEGNLEWWLMKEKPPAGSRILFWGDTMGVQFSNPHRIARLLRPYKAIWLCPFSLEEGWSDLRKHDGQDVERYLLTKPNDYHYYEFTKLQLVGVPVVGGCEDVEGLRRALRKVR